MFRHIMVHEKPEKRTNPEMVISEQEKIEKLNASLRYAVFEEQNIEDAKKYLSEGADIDTISLPYTIKESSIDMIRFLLEYKANVNDNGLTRGSLSLLEAIELGSIEIVSLLLDHKASVKEIDDCRHCGRLDITTPLISAIENDHMDIARLLIEQGADIHSRKGLPSQYILDTVSELREELQEEREDIIKDFFNKDRLFAQKIFPKPLISIIVDYIKPGTP